jgi:hypothetical protein
MPHRDRTHGVEFLGHHLGRSNKVVVDARHLVGAQTQRLGLDRHHGRGHPYIVHRRGMVAILPGPNGLYERQDQDWRQRGPAFVAVHDGTPPSRRVLRRLFFARPRKPRADRCYSTPPSVLPRAPP